MIWEREGRFMSMKVVDTERWSWFLFEYDGDLFLDAHCSISAFSYTFMVKLNEDELKEYACSGRDYICKLAHDIHYSYPIGKDSSSVYKGRDVSKQFSGFAKEAVLQWRKDQSN